MIEDKAKEIAVLWFAHGGESKARRKAKEAAIDFELVEAEFGKMYEQMEKDSCQR